MNLLFPYNLWALLPVLRFSKRVISLHVTGTPGYGSFLMASLVTGTGPSFYELSLFTIPAGLTTGTQFIPPNATLLQPQFFALPFHTVVISE